MPDPQINRWYLGIDLGTGSCKTVVINNRANVLGFGAGEYRSMGVDSKWQEQDPQAILEGMIKSVSTALTNAGNLPGECGGLSMGGALHSIMAIDRHGNPLTGVITWADSRAAKQAQKLKNTSLASDIYQKTGCPIHGMYPLYKIIWLRENQPDVFQKATQFISAKEYVFAHLTGKFWVDFGLASGSGLLNTHTLQWDSDALAVAGIRTDHLSELHSPRKIHHGVDPKLASKMGISPETAVILGSSDAANSSMGAGAVHPWQATLMVGTSGAYRVVSPKPVLDDQARSWCYSLDETHWLVGGSINNAGLALSWWKDAVNHSLANTDNPQLSFGDF